MALLDGRVAIVTGASKGIGAGVAIGLARHGAAVAVNYKTDAEGAADTVRSILAGAGRAVAVQADVGEPDDARRLVAETVEQLGGMDVLVNNAGRTRFGPASGVSLEDWDDVVTTNLRGTFFTTVAAVERMPSTGGSVINISSCAATLMVRDHSIYTMTKTGIEGLSRQLALEYAPRNVRVNVLAPAATSGERNRAYDPDYDRKWASVTPLGRVGVPEDYVGPIVFLSSDLSAFLTGQTLNVDGGWSLAGHTPDMSDYDYSSDPGAGLMAREVGVGIVGGGWMGNVHSRAYTRLPSLDPEAALRPRLVHVADDQPAVLASMQQRWGWERASADWRSVVDDPDVELVDICAPTRLHCEIAVAAAGAGKHVYCEKPLGRSLDETRRIADAVGDAGVCSLVGYNYRWMPALQHARALVADGRLGQITHVRSVFHTDWGASPNAPFSWRFDRDESGSGALGDMGSHVVDTAELLVGPIVSVTGTAATFVDRRPLARLTQDAAARGASVFGAVEPGTETGWREVTNEDYVAALVTFASGARGTIELSRAINGPRSRFAIELNGTHGAFSWDLERMNEYELWLRDDLTLESGYRRVLVGPDHPDHALFSPGAGVGIAFEDSKAIEVYRLLLALAEGRAPEPDFAVGLRVAEVLDAVAESFRTQSWRDVAPAGAPAV